MPNKTPMSRFHIHDDLTAPEASLPILKGLQSSAGQLPNFLGVLAGSAAALLGAVQFGLASVITPLTGLVSTGSAVGMAVVMTGAVWLGAVVLLVLVRPSRITVEQDEVTGMASAGAH